MVLGVPSEVMATVAATVAAVVATVVALVGVMLLGMGKGRGKGKVMAMAMAMGTVGRETLIDRAKVQQHPALASCCCSPLGLAPDQCLICQASQP